MWTRPLRQQSGPLRSYSETSVAERLALLRKIIEIYKAKNEEMAEAISQEMGAPMTLARKAQAPAGLGHLLEAARVLENFKFEELKGSTLMRKEAIGVCGLITPWNWPMNQVAAKVAPALAAGCTMVLKPSEMAPLSAMLFAQILHEAGSSGGRVQSGEWGWADCGLPRSRRIRISRWCRLRDRRVRAFLWRRPPRRR